MSKLNIQVGKVYKNRSGGHVTIYKVIQNNNFVFEDVNGETYTVNGKYYDTGVASDKDLVAEVEKVSTTLEEVPPLMSTFGTGAVRSTDASGVRYDLITPIGLRRIAETYQEGFKKYGAFNWEKGFPISDIMNHAIRHIFLYLEGYRHDPLTGAPEDHLAHATWNLLAAMHMEESHPNLDHGLRPIKENNNVQSQS